MSITLLLFFLSQVFLGQNSVTIDSLLTHLSVQKRDTMMVGTLNDLAWEYRKTEPEKARDYANKAKKLSDSLFYQRGAITSLIRLGSVAIYRKEYDTAEIIYLDVLDKELKANYQYGIGRAQNQLGLIYKNKGDLRKALDYSLNSLNVYENLKNKNLVAVVANNVGAIYKGMGNYDLAMNFFIKSLETRKISGNQLNVGHSLLNIGAFYNTLENYPKAIEYLNQSREIFESSDQEYELAKVYNNLGISYYNLQEYNSSLEYYEKALKLKHKLGLKFKDASTLNNLGALYHRMDNLDMALQYYLKSISIQENSSNGNMLIDSKINIADIYYRRKEYEKSIDGYIEAFDLAEKSNKKVIQLKILNDLSLCYSALEKYNEALKYSNRYIVLKDSIEDTYKAAVIFKANYEEQEKLKEIAEVNLEKVESENKKQNIIIGSLIAGVVLITLLFFSILKIRHQEQRVIVAEKDKKIGQQKIEELMKNQELKSINAMMDGQEGERRRIAKDLHDRLGSMLSMVKVHFKSVEENIEILKVSNKNRYIKANDLLDDACEEVRKIAYNMSSGVLGKFGLVSALEDLKKTLEQTKKIEVEFVTHNLNDRLNNDVEISIYRIVQELISNILKHAEAKEISIQLVRSDQGLNLVVEDDGVGFEMDSQTNTGMGFKNVASRVDKLNGKLEIDSKVGRGTTITVDIPINKT